MKKIIFVLLALIIFATSTKGDTGDVCFSIKEAEELYKRLEKDKAIIRWQAKRWNNLINTIPKIHYKIIDETKVVIQKVEFQIEGDKPLIYEIKFEVLTKKEKIRYFPFTISMAAMVESGIGNSYVDPKIGVQFFSLEPLKINIIEGLGAHLYVGVYSAGGSISWRPFKKVLGNTRVHFYSGVSYKGTRSFGGGISLNF